MKIVGLVAMSHSPSWNLSVHWQGPGEHYVRAVAAARARLQSVKPSALVIFGPDHARNFFYDLMPTFCIGAETVEGFGDYSSPSGPLPCDAELARIIIRGVMDQGFDPALSLKMGVDHGITQPYAALDPELATRIVPIMISSYGEPLPSLRRCYEFGRAVGRVIRASSRDGTVVVIGSGGLSHSPPSLSPDDPGVSPAMRDYLINGRARAREFSSAREGQSAERRARGGHGPINVAWDRWFLERIERNELDAVLEISSQALLRDAGVGGQELRAWVAALGAWGGPVTTIAYEPVPTWITGMGCISSFEPASPE